MQANDFLQAYMANNLGTSGQGPELGANVRMPILEGPELAANVLMPILEGPKQGLNRRVQMDIPGVADDATIQPIGLYGNELAPGDPRRDYGMTHEVEQNQIRGMMPPVQGGIPAPAGYNMEASKAKFPNFFEGVKPGNVPAFYR